MKLNKQILKAISEGVQNALSASLMLDDFEDDEDISVTKSDREFNRAKQLENSKKTVYSNKLQSMLHDPTNINAEFIEQFIELAEQYYEEYGAQYNPHLDGEKFKDFIHICLWYKGYNANLNWVNVIDVTDMSKLFEKGFSGDISEWDVSNVENMERMFDENCSFNSDISSWDVSNVKNMRCMFLDSNFSGDISSWDVSNVEDMYYMFAYSNFNSDISEWDVSSVKSMNNMFLDCPIREEYKPKLAISN